MSFKIINSIFLALAAVYPVAAIPTKSSPDTQYAEVIPGPGLPSLASLNLTTAELYETPYPPAAKRKLSARFDPVCGPEEKTYTNVNDVIACYNYLNSLGTQDCAVPANLAVASLCTAGSAKATGQSLNMDAQSSHCRDVARGLLYVVDHCTRSDGTVAGFQSANGNGNLIVGGTNVNW